MRPSWSCKALDPEDACPTALTQAGRYLVPFFGFREKDRNGAFGDGSMRSQKRVVSVSMIFVWMFTFFVKVFMVFSSPVVKKGAITNL